MEAFDGGLGYGEICEIDFIFFVKVLFVDEGSFLFGFLQFVVIEVLSRARGFVLDPFLELLDICEPLCLANMFLLLHC